MTAWQERVHEICYEVQLVNPKRIANELGRAHNYVSDQCLRDRGDPFSLCNAIIREAERIYRAEPAKILLIAEQFATLLLRNTRFNLLYVAPDSPPAPFGELCAQTGILLKSLGSALDAMAAIEADGRYTDKDDGEIAEFILHGGRLVEHMQKLMLELNRRRAAAQT